MRRASYVVLAALAGGCASAGARRASQPTPQATQAAESSSVERAQYPSSYRRHPNSPVVIRNATIMTATGQEITIFPSFIRRDPFAISCPVAVTIVALRLTTGELG